jgi:predicted RNA-binding Zn-ribbon protein involved in translation (DUF1610 family)
MSSTAEVIEIVCPECGEEYVDWYRPGDGTTDHAVCPTCGYDLSVDPVAHEDGGWTLVSGEDDYREG